MLHKVISYPYTLEGTSTVCLRHNAVRSNFSTKVQSKSVKTGRKFLCMHAYNEQKSKRGKYLACSAMRDVPRLTVNYGRRTHKSMILRKSIRMETRARNKDILNTITTGSRWMQQSKLQKSVCWTLKVLLMIFLPIFFRLRTYEQQLVQVRTALEADPKNEELRVLEEELQKIIDLNKDLLSSQNVASSSSSADTIASTTKPNSDNIEAKQKYAAGDECQAKYEGDGRFYDARIVSVAGSQHNPMYTILFKGYNETAIVNADSLKPSKYLNGSQNRFASSDQAQSSSSSPALGSRPPKLTPEEEAERERKKKRSEKKNERFANRTAEAQAVQNSWQKFAKKAEKKGHMKKEKSMFKTPDDPLAKGEWRYTYYDEVVYCILTCSSFLQLASLELDVV